MSIIMIDINSGDINSIGYDKHNNSLFINFKNGNGIFKYKYLEVPIEVYNSFKNSKNRYAYYHGQIKHKYRNKQI